MTRLNEDGRPPVGVLKDDKTDGKGLGLGTGRLSPAGSRHLKRGLGSPVSSGPDGACCPVLGVLVVVFTSYWDSDANAPFPEPPGWEPPAGPPSLPRHRHRDFQEASAGSLPLSCPQQRRLKRTAFLMPAGDRSWLGGFPLTLTALAPETSPWTRELVWVLFERRCHLHGLSSHTVTIPLHSERR